MQSYKLLRKYLVFAARVCVREKDLKMVCTKTINSITQKSWLISLACLLAFKLLFVVRIITDKFMGFAMHISKYVEEWEHKSKALTHTHHHQQMIVMTVFDFWIIALHFHSHCCHIVVSILKMIYSKVQPEEKWGRNKSHTTNLNVFIDILKNFKRFIERFEHLT